MIAQQLRGARLRPIRSGLAVKILALLALTIRQRIVGRIGRSNQFHIAIDRNLVCARILTTDQLIHKAFAQSASVAATCQDIGGVIGTCPVVFIQFHLLIRRGEGFRYIVENLVEVSRAIRTPPQKTHRIARLQGVNRFRPFGRIPFIIEVCRTQCRRISLR